MKHEAIDVSMIADYFTRDGLTKKTGIASSSWNLVILKELIDNALDAIEPLPEKRIEINYNPDRKELGIYDNGDGIRSDSIEHSIYDFSVYHSSKRHYVTPSRGKQGNGLKTIICICFLSGYDLLWHSSEGDILRLLMDDALKEYGEISVTRQAVGKTEKRGVTVTGFYYRHLREIVREYAVCNPDVDFIFKSGMDQETFEARAAPVDRSSNTNIGFYDLPLFKSLLARQDANKTYKRILQEIFGTVIANKSAIKGKLKDIDTDNLEFASDFQSIRSSQNKKRFTILKAHTIGLEHSFFTEDIKTGIPYCIEFTVRKLSGKSEELQCLCYVNNTITYTDARSMEITGDERNCKVGTRKAFYPYADNLNELLSSYSDYCFELHFISPQFSYLDTGKVSFDISGIVGRLCEELTRVINKIQKQYRETVIKPPSKRALMRQHLPDAFNLASSDGKYCITARQLYYKLRELSGLEETQTTYADYTQNILTEWLEQNPEAEEKVFFSDRGNFYIGSDQNGLGTGSVRAVIDADGTAKNRFVAYGGLSDSIYLQPEFDLRYEYDKVLYIEKTGFDAVFKAERIAEKHHLIIVSGQGFGTRAAKTLLYYLQQQGLKIFCMHDLDYSGINIINSLREANDKFPEPIQITDIGVTLEEVRQYGISPERVNIDRKDYAKIDQGRYTPEQQAFFFHSGYLQRVELNAFTTAQILEIIDSKLAHIDELPRVSLSEAVNIDPDKIKEVALMRALMKRFDFLKDQLPEPNIIGRYADMTVQEMQERTQGIIDNLLVEMETAADEKLKKISEAS